MTQAPNRSNNQTQTASGSSCLHRLRRRRPGADLQPGVATFQAALSSAKADQNAVNANVPVNIAGGDINTGDNSANQLALNGAGSNASNDASTKQSNSQSQTDPGSSCYIGCGGTGQAQISSQGSRDLPGGSRQAPTPTRTRSTPTFRSTSPAATSTPATTAPTSSRSTGLEATPVTTQAPSKATARARRTQARAATSAAGVPARRRSPTRDPRPSRRLCQAPKPTRTRSTPTFRSTSPAATSTPATTAPTREPATSH